MVNYVEMPPGFLTKFIHKILGLLNMAGKMERKILENKYPKKPATIPKSFFRKYNVETVLQNGRKVWEITTSGTDPELIVLYLHGGAYYANINSQHWRLIEQLVLKTHARVVVPDYPLSPEAVCEEVYHFMDELYNRLTTGYPGKRMVFMGDSAGGGIALGFAQKIKNEEVRQPAEIILFSPWLDVSMSNPDQIRLERYDKLLNLNGLKMAGKKYAGNLGVTDYRVSPLFGSFDGLTRITIFTGTRDLLITDARRCKQICEAKGIRFNYFEYRDMFHDWVIVTALKESRDVIDKVRELLDEQT